MKLSLILLLLPITLSAQIGTLGPSTGFDRFEKKVLKFGKSPYYASGVDKHLNCYLYSNFMVKEYDEGQKGAEWLSIVRRQSSTVDCTLNHVAGEKVIEWQEWSGYFQGAKGDLIFFIAPDGIDGGLPFVAYDIKTGKQTFTDKAYYASIWNRPSPKTDFDAPAIRTNSDGRPVLKYLRVVATDCDLHSERSSCWNKLRAKLRISAQHPPLCRGYGSIREKYVSAVAYPVEVTFTQNPSIKTIPGPVMCWPVD